MQRNKYIKDSKTEKKGQKQREEKETEQNRS